MSTFQALWVTEGEEFQQQIIERNVADLPAGEVLIRVYYSSLNYKDALSAIGNRGVTRNYPHTPGIDAAGVVEHSASNEFAVGDEVIVTGYDLGMNTSGGLAQYIRVPAAWVVKRPTQLSLREAMILGTAGLTAALCVDKLLTSGLKPEDGEVLVTGATGGVGTVAISLLHKLGFKVIAASGKPEQTDFLLSLGASDVIARDELLQGQERPMLKPRWAAAVDTVGGEPLFNIVKSLQPSGSVACCGLTAGVDFAANVFPFILRGVNLLGVDSVEIPLSVKSAMWHKLADEWKLELASLVQEINLAQTPAIIAQMLAGQSKGRALVSLL